MDWDQVRFFFQQKCCPQRWHYCFSTCLNGSLWMCIRTSQQFLQRTDRHQIIVQHCQTSPICLVISEVRWRCGAHNKHLIWVTDLICDVCGELSSAQFYKQPCYAVLPPVRCVVWVAVSGWGVGKWRVLRTAISDKRGDLGCWHQPLRYWLGNVPHRRLFMCFFLPKKSIKWLNGGRLWLNDWPLLSAWEESSKK